MTSYNHFLDALFADLQNLKMKKKKKKKKKKKTLVIMERLSIGGRLPS